MRRLIWLLPVFLAGCLKFAGGGDKEEFKFDEVVAANRPVRRSVIAHGSLTALAEVEVKSEASGLVAEMLVERGDAVVAGQELMRLDVELLESRLRQTEAGLQNAEASLGSALLELAAAERDLERVDSLYEQGFATEEELFSSRDRVARAELTIIGSTAMRDQALEAVEERKDELDNATILAPQSGLVLSLYVEEGSAIASATSGLGQGTPIALIGDLATMRFVGLVDETEVGLVHQGMGAEVSVQSHEDEVFPGDLYRIYPLGVNRSGVISYEVEIRLPNPDMALLPAMTGEAKIVVWEEEALALPDTALIFEREKTYAWVLDADRIPEKTELTLGLIGDESVEILEGVAVGDIVVDRPAPDLEATVKAQRRGAGNRGNGKPKPEAEAEPASEEPAEEGGEGEPEATGAGEGEEPAESGE